MPGSQVATPDYPCVARRPGWTPACMPAPLVWRKTGWPQRASTQPGVPALCAPQPAGHGAAPSALAHSSDHLSDPPPLPCSPAPAAAIHATLYRFGTGALRTLQTSRTRLSLPAPAASSALDRPVMRSTESVSSESECAGRGEKSPAPLTTALPTPSDGRSVALTVARRQRCWPRPDAAGAASASGATARPR